MTESYLDAFPYRPLSSPVVACGPFNQRSDFPRARRQRCDLVGKARLAVTFGIQPTAPETGYGYIESGEPLSGSTGCKVARFVEKTDLATGREYFASGRFTWNSCMFCLTAGAMLAALRDYTPEILSAVEQTFAATRSDKDPVVLDAATFALVPDISIDHSPRLTTLKIAHK